MSEWPTLQGKLLKTVAMREKWTDDYVQDVFSLLSQITGYTAKTTDYIQGHGDLSPLIIEFNRHHYTIYLTR